MNGHLIQTLILTLAAGLLLLGLLLLRRDRRRRRQRDRPRIERIDDVRAVPDRRGSDSEWRKIPKFGPDDGDGKT